jgi:hypothetical protein
VSRYIHDEELSTVCDHELVIDCDDNGAMRLSQERSKSSAEFWRKQGIDLAASNTNENADDVEVLRKALVTRKITLWGSS